MEQDAIKEFLRELGELTNKYKIVIGGCGCCDSPWIEDAPGAGRYEKAESNYSDRIEFKETKED